MVYDSRGTSGQLRASKRQESLFHWDACENFSFIVTPNYSLLVVLIRTIRYTPLKKIDNMPDCLSYDPIRCNGCTAVLNPFV